IKVSYKGAKEDTKATKTPLCLALCLCVKGSCVLPNDRVKLLLRLLGPEVRGGEDRVLQRRATLALALGILQPLDRLAQYYLRVAHVLVQIINHCLDTHR